MKRTLINIAILSTILGTGMAQAGGFDVSGQDTSIILKEGNLLEITSVSVTPSVTGAYSAPVNGTPSSGGSVSNVAPSYSFTNLAFRTDISDDMGLAIIQDQPFGANVSWNDGTAVSPPTPASSYNGVKAQIKSGATTALVSYALENNVTVYGGLKNQSVSASASNPVVVGYSITSKTDSSTGYVLGAAFEKPEIALRVALTYHTKVDHDLAIVETNQSGSTLAPSPFSSVMSFKTPEAFNLDFQTGVAENTLLFGSIRHVKWTQFELMPPIYKGLTTAASNPSGSALKDFDHDATTYNIGLGRKLNDQWSAAVTYGTEAATGDDGSALGPTDGYTKIGVGVTYTGEQVAITLGVQKANLGDTVIPTKYTEAPTFSGTPTTMTDAGTSVNEVIMKGNTSMVTAVKMSYKF